MQPTIELFASLRSGADGWQSVPALALHGHLRFFHKRSSCDDPNDKENDNVESDDDSGSHFQSSSVNSSTYSIQDSSQAVTLTGTGTHNGLPVSFTMVGVNYGDVAPGVFQITLTDGYIFNGILLDGSINIQ